MNTAVADQRLTPTKTAPHNFSGGPGALPQPVLEETQRAIMQVPGQPFGLLGISHRSTWFRDVVDEAEANIRELLQLSDRYSVLFLQGGGSLQFSMVPITLLRHSPQAAEYLETGYWSHRAIVEARREGPVHVLWNGRAAGFRSLPAPSELHHNPEAAYFHYVSNETVEGLQFHHSPGHENVLRVCDMSSDFLSRPFDASPFALIYAHAQKNLGPAGVTVVIVREDILERVPDNLPAMLDYREHACMGSIYNTAPVFAIYVTMLVTRWLRDSVGGLEEMEAINRAKAAELYQAIDASQGFYRGHAAPEARSLMNVVFSLLSPKLEQRFLAQAESAGLYGLAGHRSLGGIRASLYNAVTPAAVHALCGFMEFFRLRYQDSDEA
ncbi:MAG: 3-phosphoserine/phosphohydroxythreonine transaminase [Acidobacteriia bacterium]|nr:3-phosphoserine/phosphohydroxythreonine transaminase [Terriglobia bacterium]